MTWAGGKPVFIVINYNDFIHSDFNVLLNNVSHSVTSSIRKNIQYLSDNGLLFDEYTDIPTGPFAIINKTFDELLSVKISSVPLNKFTFKNTEEKLKNVSRISVSVNHELFVEYFLWK